MASVLTRHWWGTRCCMDEVDTQAAIVLLKSSADVASLLGGIAGGDASVIAKTTSGFAKAGVQVIKHIDEANGNAGVCVWTLWVGPTWVTAHAGHA